MEQCSLGNTDVTLQDLDTEDPNVVQIFNSWIKGLIADYGFEAIRIDTVKHVRKVSFRLVTRTMAFVSCETNSVFASSGLLARFR